MFISASTRRAEIKLSLQLMLPPHLQTPEDAVHTFEFIFQEVIFELHNFHVTHS